MALGITHAIVGIGVFSVFALFLSMFATDLGLAENLFDSTLLAITSIYALAFSLLGSILPDIDHRQSKIYKKTRKLLCILTAVIAFSIVLISTDDLISAAIAGVIGLTVTFTIITVFKPRHRGFTHTIRAAAIYGLVVSALYFFSFEQITLFSGMPTDESIMILLTTMIFMVSFTAYLSHNILDKELKF